MHGVMGLTLTGSTCQTSFSNPEEQNLHLVFSELEKGSIRVGVGDLQWH